MDSVFADVCGNGLTGNASLVISSLHPHLDAPNYIDSIGGSYLYPHQTAIFTPKKPEYASFEARLASFNTSKWPAASCPVRVQLLAAAGLFYYGDFQGHFDSVKCYHCGVGLCKWEPGDDAWSEHSRSSPHCFFIQDLLNRSRYRTLRNQLVNRVTEPRRPMSLEIQALTNGPISPQDSLSPCTSTSSDHDSETENLNTTNNTGTSENVPAAPNSSGKESTQCSRLTCKICLLQELSVLFLPCRHLVSCTSCATQVTKCPACRENIGGALETYIC